MFVLVVVVMPLVLDVLGGSVAEWQAVKFVAALLRFLRVTAGLAKSDGSLPPGL